MNFLVKALSEGIADAGARHFSNYPGFHSNELHAALGASVTSIDEKSAFSFAWGCSMAGARSAVSFKNVGLNDAADAFLGALFVGCRAGLVFILFDDCDIQHSQSRIDVRPYFLVYGGLWLEPRSVPEAYRLARDAFEMSEKFGLPVVVRVTNILWDQGLAPSSWERAASTPPSFPEVARLADASPWVVHPSEAHRMERDLAGKNKEIERWVETLYCDAPESCDAIIAGAKRGVVASSPFRLFTFPVPRAALRARFSTTEPPVVYEHGPTPFAARLVDSALRDDGVLCQSRGMPPPAWIRPKYHNHSYMEKLFSILRDSGAMVFGDLGGFTMDPGRTIQFCLCYGTSVAAATGFAETRPDKRVFCVTGDAAYLHSGQQCLHEMAARGVSATVFVLENGGALGTGGQPIPGDLSVRPASATFYEIDYASMTADQLSTFVDSLPHCGINLVIVHTHEQETSSNG